MTERVPVAWMREQAAGEERVFFQGSLAARLRGVLPHGRERAPCAARGKERVETRNWKLDEGERRKMDPAQDGALKGRRYDPQKPRPRARWRPPDQVGINSGTPLRPPQAHSKMAP